MRNIYLLLAFLLIGLTAAATEPSTGHSSPLDGIFKQRYLYEPECEAVGSRIAVADDTLASSGQYLSAAGAVFPDTAPGNDPADYVRLHFNPDSDRHPPADYVAYFRVHQANSVPVAFWLRTNGGEWKLHTYTTSNPLVSEGGWGWVPNVEEPASNALGLNGDTLLTLDIAFTRADQQLDEVYLEVTNLASYHAFLRPFKRNYVGTNCPDFVNIPPVAYLDPGGEVLMRPFSSISVEAGQSYDPDGEVVQYFFRGIDDFGDIPDYSSSSASYYYEGEGTYTYSATVYDFYGASDSDYTQWKMFMDHQFWTSNRPRFKIALACAQVGDYWTLQKNPSDKLPYLISGGPEASTAQVPDDLPENQITFVLEDLPEIPEPDNDAYSYDPWYPIHYLTGTFIFPTPKDNCLWVNFNNKGWVRWDVISRNSTGPEVVLQPGDNTLQLAYCSSDLQITALGLEPDNVSFSSIPFDTGCDSPSQPIQEYWLEAECAAVGLQWQNIFDPKSSNDFYVKVIDRNAYTTPTADRPEDYVRFTAAKAIAGTYQLQARIRAPTKQSDSYYVRVNEGPWYPWTSGIQRDTDFLWNLFPGSGIELLKGDNTIDFAYREGGTQLDRIYLGPAIDPITGLGRVVDGSCSINGNRPIIASINAECASYGRAWTLRGDDNAARGAYLVAETANSLSAPPPAIPDNLITFSFNSSNSDPKLPLFLYARVDAATANDDSYWVRFNGGKWYAWKTIKDGPEGFQWNRLPITLTGLVAGTNTIDFAYRESGAKLDGINVSSIDRLHDPGLTNPNGCKGYVALEAECGIGSGGWKAIPSSQAGRAEYASFVGTRHLDPPIANDPGAELVYTFDLTEAATYYLHLRLNAPDNGRNSVWVRVDDGKWIKMWKQIGGAQLHTDGFEWRTVNDEGVRERFELSIGTHTIRIANREPGTGIDQLYITFTSVPRNIVPGTPACPPASQGVSAVELKSAASTAIDESFRLDLYPNPAVNEIKLSLQSAYSGNVDVTLYDAHGRRVNHYSYTKVDELLDARLNISDLPSGLYRLRVIEGDRTTVRSFVRR